eukprot:scaffold43911_cov38-Tisochrysis_lutea.AAC.1
MYLYRIWPEARGSPEAKGQKAKYIYIMWHMYSAVFEARPGPQHPAPHFPSRATICSMFCVFVFVFWAPQVGRRFKEQARLRHPVRLLRLLLFSLLLPHVSRLSFETEDG